MPLPELPRSLRLLDAPRFTVPEEREELELRSTAGLLLCELLELLFVWNTRLGWLCLAAG